MEDIRGKTVLITGGVSGIGRIMALLFAKNLSYRLALWTSEEKT